MPSAPKWFFDGIEALQSSHILEVTETELLSSSIRRIRLMGNIETLKFPVGAYIDLSVSSTAVRRYTIANADKSKGFIEFIVHRQHKGCGRDFLGRIRLDDQLIINQPRGTVRAFEPGFDQYIFFGDESALGLAQSFLPQLKANNIAYQFLFELAEENKHIPHLIGLDNAFSFPKKDCFRNQDWLDQLAVFQAKENSLKTKCVIVGNVTAAQTIRKVIRAKMKTKITLQGYWLEGKKGL